MLIGSYSALQRSHMLHGLPDWRTSGNRVQRNLQHQHDVRYKFWHMKYHTEGEFVPGPFGFWPSPMLLHGHWWWWSKDRDQRCSQWLQWKQRLLQDGATRPWGTRPHTIRLKKIRVLEEGKTSSKCCRKNMAGKPEGWKTNGCQKSLTITYMKKSPKFAQSMP